MRAQVKKYPDVWVPNPAPNIALNPVLFLTGAGLSLYVKWAESSREELWDGAGCRAASLATRPPPRAICGLRCCLVSEQAVVLDFLQAGGTREGSELLR